MTATRTALVNGSAFSSHAFSSNSSALTTAPCARISTSSTANSFGVSAEELLEKAWDENADPFTNAVRVAVMTLRRKLGDPPVIDTVPGAGYRLGP